MSDQERKRQKPSAALAAHREDIRRVVASPHGRNARVFGSAVRNDDHEGSDLDLLIDPTPETTLFDLGAIRHELSQPLGVPVDVLTPRPGPKKSGPEYSTRRNRYE